MATFVSMLRDDYGYFQFIFFFTFYFSQVPNKILLTRFLLKHEFRRKLKEEN